MRRALLLAALLGLLSLPAQPSVGVQTRVVREEPQSAFTPLSVASGKPRAVVADQGPDQVPRRSPRPVRPPTVADAKAYALRRLGPAEYACLDAVAVRESHWNPLARNRSSGAYGIPQALPGSKMASYGADWRTSPVTQVRWMIGYVNGRYGGACAAKAHSDATGWY